MEQPIPQQKQRGHGFLLSLLALMVISLIAWAYFLYLVPDVNSEYDSYYVAPSYKANPTDTSAIEADLNAAGTIDNSSDLNEINQSFY